MTTLTIDLLGVAALRVLGGDAGPKGLCKLMLHVVGTVVELVVCKVTEYGAKKADAPAKGLGLGCEIVTCLS